MRYENYIMDSDVTISGGSTYRITWVEILSAFLLALVPLGLCWHNLQQFFWYGDDIHLLAQTRYLGFWPWVTVVFAENFVPLFKVAWGGAVWLFGGSYSAMLLINWSTHACNTALLGLVLRRYGICGFGWWVAVCMYGLPWTNIETLTWSVQWSAILATTFTMIAINLLAVLRLEQMSASRRWISVLLLFSSCLASTLCFSKGVIASAALAVWALFPSEQLSLRYRLAAAAAALSSALAVALVIATCSSGNHTTLIHANTEIIAEMFRYGAAYFFLNPVYLFLEMQPLTALTWSIALIGLLKVAVMVGGFMYGALGSSLEKGKRELLLFLVLLLLFDLMNSVAIGVGRYHEGLTNAMSSRYQATCLLSFAPFAGIVLGQLVARGGHYARIKAWISPVFASLLIIGLVWRWPAKVDGWVETRGTEGRGLLQGPVPPPPDARWIGVPSFIPMDEARLIVKEFRLH